MLNKNEHKVLFSKVDKSYNSIASKFSASRNKPWIEFDLYKNFVSAGASVLDIGCGNARLLLHLDDLNINYTGLDISSQMLEMAKENVQSTQSDKRFVNSNILDANFDNDSFDNIFAVASFHHLHGFYNRLLFLRKLYYWSKPNSTACVSVWNLWQRKYLPNFVAAFLAHFWRFNDLNIKFGKTPRFYHAFTVTGLRLLIFLSPYKSYKLVFVDKKGYKTNKKNSHNIIMVLNK